MLPVINAGITGNIFFDFSSTFHNLVALVHLVGVTVVGGDESHAAQLVNDSEDASQLEIQCLHGATGSQQRAGMTHHVAVGEVDTVVGVLACLQRLDELIGDLGALHPGSLLEGDYVGGGG